MRLNATEDWLSARLELGRHDEVVPELILAVADHPTTERLVELLMLALYRSGRRAAALGAYARIRASLDAELGIDPGVRLRELHRAILRDEPVPVGQLVQAP